MKTCAADSEYIFYVEEIAWLVLGLFQCFLKNVRLVLKDNNERLLLKEKNVRLIFFVCVAASRNILMFFKERAAASEKILRVC